MTLTKPSPTRRLTILLAEDDEDDVFLIRRALERLRILERLVLTRDGEQTIAYLKNALLHLKRASNPFPDVLILDHRMPRVHGLDVLSWLRAEPQFTALPVVLYSLGLSPTQAEMIGQLNAACCMKSAENSDMPATIAEAIDRAIAMTSKPCMPMSWPDSRAEAARDRLPGPYSRPPI